MSPCLVAQTPMDKLITDIAFLVIAHHGGIQKPWEEEKAENENMMNNFTRMISHKVRPNVILRKPSK